MGFNQSNSHVRRSTRTVWSQLMRMMWFEIPFYKCFASRWNRKTRNDWTKRQVSELSSNHWDNGLMHSSTVSSTSNNPLEKSTAQFCLHRRSKPTTHGTLIWAQMWNLKENMGPFLKQRHGTKHIPLIWSVEPFMADAWITDASKISEWLKLLNLTKTSHEL